MNGFDALLERTWVTKEEDPSLFYALYRMSASAREEIRRLFGWKLFVTDQVVKLEKVPAEPQAWMGISSFQEPRDYCLFCALLLYLADRDSGSQFLLSDLTRAIEMTEADNKVPLRELCAIDWTQTAHRRSLVRVLKFAQKVGILLVSDGDSEGYSGNASQQVLYENTGLARAFPTHFGRSTLSCQTPEDYLDLDPVREASSPADTRRRKIYRRLALTPGVYRDPADPREYEYIRNPAMRVQQNLEKLLPGALQVYRNGAFYVLRPEERVGDCWPRQGTLADIALLLCARLREGALENRVPRGQDDSLELSREKFQEELAACREAVGGGWSRKCRETPDDRLREDLISYMESWMLLEDHGDTLVIRPAAGRWIGHYPPEANVSLQDADPGEGSEEDEEEEAADPGDDPDEEAEEASDGDRKEEGEWEWSVGS